MKSPPPAPDRAPSRRPARGGHAGLKTSWLVVTIVLHATVVILGLGDASYGTAFLAMLGLPAADLVLITWFAVASWRARRDGAKVPSPWVIVGMTLLFFAVTELVLFTIDAHGW